jgi:alpha-ketoglutarate-dependent taurine dioxygenase
MESTTSILNEAMHSSTTSIPRSRLDGPIVWDAAILQPTDGIVRLEDDARRELDEIVITLRGNRLPIEMLEPHAFQMEACHNMMGRVKATLENGVGFVIIDRLPLEEYSKAEATAVYWILSQLVCPPVAQSWDGKMIYDVRDTGKPPGNGVRPDVTNAEQNFHTDNSYNVCPPDYMALLCLRTAKEGGVSSIVSFHTVYNEMLESHPKLVDRLFAPFLFDRNKEHAPGASPVISHSIMQVANGVITGRLSRRHVINGHAMVSVPLDFEGEEALDTLEATMNQPKLIREFIFEPGQIQFVDNRRLGHRRTGYTDYAEEDRKRHLVRLWLRSTGRRFYNG